MSESEFTELENYQDWFVSIYRVIATQEAISRNEGCGATCSCVFVFARVARGCSFFGGKEMNVEPGFMRLGDCQD